MLWIPCLGWLQVPLGWEGAWLRGGLPHVRGLRRSGSRRYGQSRHRPRQHQRGHVLRINNHLPFLVTNQVVGRANCGKLPKLRTHQTKMKSQGKKTCYTCTWNTPCLPAWPNIEDLINFRQVPVLSLLSLQYKKRAIQKLISNFPHIFYHYYYYVLLICTSKKLMVHFTSTIKIKMSLQNF